MSHWVGLLGIGLLMRMPMAGGAESMNATLTVAPELARSGSFAAKVPPPEQIIGFAPGTRPVRYHEALAYYEALAAASDRVRLRDYGRSSGGRRLFTLTFSSPENLANLATVRAELRQLGDGTLDGAAARSMIARLPVTAWMGYGIHGSEISGPDAALELAYRLAASDDDAVRELLRNAVIHLDPMFNPDGRERAVGHLQAFSRRTAMENPGDLAHGAIWPQGRGNHYFFDLNRDALYTVQQEARARVAAILDARPQLVVDAHEMGTDNTFLFAMPAEPFNPLLPADVHTSWQTFAVDHAEAFDRDGTSFYTRSWNEVFYPGYFDIWPAYHGAVPIIYEQAATRGTTVRLPNGVLRSYAQSVEHQLRSSLTNLQTATGNREALLTRWWQARRTAVSGEGARRRAWFILPDDSYKLERAAATLLAQGLAVERLQRAVRVSGLHSLWDGESRSMELPAGTLRISSAQPMAAIAHNLLALHVPMAPDFLVRERQRLDRSGSSSLYDTTAWSLPHAYGANVLWSASIAAGDWQPLASVDDVVKVAARLAEGRYGYLYRDPSLFVTARLLQRGVKIRVAQEALVHEGISYEPGTLLIRNDDQSQPVIQTLREQQHRDGAEFVTLNSARIVEGPDLGDSSFQLLQAPKIAVLGGLGLLDASVGAVMHLLDVSVGVPFTLLDVMRLGEAELEQFNVIVMPDTAEQPWSTMLETGRLQALQRWLDNGGTLIALRGGANALISAKWTAVRARQEVIEAYPPLMLGRSARDVIAQDFVRAVGTSSVDPSPPAEFERRFLPVVGPAAQAYLNAAVTSAFEFPASAPSLQAWAQDVPAPESLKSRLGPLLRRYLPRGAYLSTELRPGHWLAFGVPTRLPALFREPDVWIAETGSEAIGRYDQVRALTMSGLVWPEAVGYIAGTANLVRERRGAGQIILFANDPLFRGYSLGTQRLFMNATVLGPACK